MMHVASTLSYCNYRSIKMMQDHSNVDDSRRDWKSYSFELFNERNEPEIHLIYCICTLLNRLSQDKKVEVDSLEVACLHKKRYWPQDIIIFVLSRTVVEENNQLSSSNWLTVVIFLYYLEMSEGLY
jgi:hypothetical protein